MTPPANAASLVTDKAAALLEEVKALPSADRETFARLFHSWETAGEGKLFERSGAEAPPVQWPDFAGRMKKLFPNGPIPGDPQEFWDEEREDRV